MRTRKDIETHCNEVSKDMGHFGWIILLCKLILEVALDCRDLIMDHR